ncbi:hypothetical protein LTS18_010608 [Coniosporium uncinatum]|uniref:Uncharacterized protein n=1 Tax=Coniosporium uncinatum TaxID=93489 RepID=A0ACC3DWU5_9PEZI|nr:hypothetical protein LTS18_010608 [Coniosporium uncinatum]
MDLIKPVKQKCSATKPVTETSKTRGLVDRYSITSNSRESTDKHLLESPLPSTHFASTNAGSQEIIQEQTTASIPADFEQATNTVSQRERASIELARKREDLMRRIGWDGTFVYLGCNPWVFCHPERMLGRDEAGGDEDEDEVTLILGDEYEDCASPRQYLKAWAPGRPRARQEKRRTYGKLQATSSTSVMFDNLLGVATRHLVCRAVYKAGSSRNAITHSLHQEEIQQRAVPGSPLSQMHSRSPTMPSECLPSVSDIPTLNLASDCNGNQFIPGLNWTPVALEVITDNNRYEHAATKQDIEAIGVAASPSAYFIEHALRESAPHSSYYCHEHLQTMRAVKESDDSQPAKSALLHSLNPFRDLDVMPRSLVRALQASRPLVADGYKQQTSYADSDSLSSIDPALLLEDSRLSTPIASAEIPANSASNSGPGNSQQHDAMTGIIGANGYDINLEAFRGRLVEQYAGTKVLGKRKRNDSSLGDGVQERKRHCGSWR